MTVLDGQKAISAVLSILLLALIALGVGILLYSFVTGILENVIETPQPFSLSVENVAINDTCMTVYIRNSGNRDVTIDKVYINNEPRHFLPFNSKLIIIKNSAGKVCIPGLYHKGALYEVKIICSSGYALLLTRRY